MCWVNHQKLTCKKRITKITKTYDEMPPVKALFKSTSNTS
jgi:hypothetical protein